MGRRRVRPVPRDVRVRDLGYPQTPAAARARPPRDQAAVLGEGRVDVLFGSEVKALLASGLFASEANIAALPELLSTRYIPGTETMFAG